MHSLALAALCVASVLQAQSSRARIRLPGYADPFPIEDVTSTFAVDAPLARAYGAVKAAFDDLQVPLSVDEGHGAVLGNQNIKAVAGFGGYRLSRLVDCGSSTMGLNADTFRVSLVFLALLDSTDATHTQVRIGFIGGGEPIASATRQGVQCASTGVMEARLMEIVSKRLR
ncbi:MAG TPA: hypothetical protein VHE78_07145 [Gemmatimonadaceae bacterium]|nr:hypothetical protein [Gemmatimonadaceae bacterium]